MTTLERSGLDGSSAAAVQDPSDPGSGPGSHPADDRGGRSWPLTWLVAVVGIVLAPLAVVAILTVPAISAEPSARAAAAPVVSAAALEEVYGIRVDLVAVTADGGLIDLRFTVTDKDKAAHVFHDVAAMPELYVEGSGTILTAPKPMAHKLNLLDGASYFLLFPNAGGAIQRATPVSVVIDGIRLAPIGAES